MIRKYIVASLRIILCATYMAPLLCLTRDVVNPETGHRPMLFSVASLLLLIPTLLCWYLQLSSVLCLRDLSMSMHFFLFVSSMSGISR